MRKWIYANLDKVAHVSISVILTIVISWIFLVTISGISVLISAVCGFIGTMIIGVLKEISDKIRGGGKIDVYDLLADLIGGILGGLLGLLIL
jgi:VanZ family protein